LDVHETLDPPTPGQGFSVREAMNQRTGVYATW
jgi:hypothetical protein